jgi:ABC-type multidrug transport system ATPase subunit
LTKKYIGSRDTTVAILSQVTASLKLGYITCLLGSNGAGKTTMLKILCGLDTYYSGDVSIDADWKSKYQPKKSASKSELGQSSNNNHKDIPISQAATKPCHNHRLIGWCPQKDAIFDQLTVKEHMVLFLRLLNCTNSLSESSLHKKNACPEGSPNSKSNRNDDANNQSTNRFTCSSVLSRLYSSFKMICLTSTEHDKAAKKLLRQLNMEEHEAKRGCELSGGMKRRLSLLMACAGDPYVLLLDEPTSGDTIESLFGRDDISLILV